MKKSIGILGGMGPLATCDLMQKIISLTDAKCDQDNVHICVDCNTEIPDRTAAILNGGENPLPQMIKSARNLQNMGADAILISCNTAHYFVNELEKYINVPIIHMPKQTAVYLKNQGIKKVAVLATDGTIQSGIYETALIKENICAVYPNKEEQQIIMSLIYDSIKAGKSFEHLYDALYSMLQRFKDIGVQAIILGCTELPIVFNYLNVDIPTVDPTNILAMEAVSFAGAKIKNQNDRLF